PGHLPSPSSRLTRGASSLERIVGRESARLRFGDLCSSMWLVKECRARTFPPAVTLKRFCAPECVFILGIIASRRLWHARGAAGGSALSRAGLAGAGIRLGSALRLGGDHSLGGRVGGG